MNIFPCPAPVWNIGMYLHFAEATGSIVLFDMLANDQFDIMTSREDLFEPTTSLEHANAARRNGYYVIGAKQAADHGHVVSFLRHGNPNPLVMDAGGGKHWIRDLDYSWTFRDLQDVTYFIYRFR